MSTKNRVKDRDHNGRIRRKYTARLKGGVHYGSSPGWWVNEFMTRPARVEEREFWEADDSSDYVDWSGAEPVSLPNLKP